jgi:Ca-activated chloride channel family protein
MRGLLVVVLLCLSSIAFADQRALVIVIDRSGSMQGPRLERAKEAALASAGKLDAKDQIAVIAFDSEAKVYVPLQAPTKPALADIAKIKAGGGTNIYPGLKEAHALLQPITAKTKHVILLSFGLAPTAGISDLVKEMRKAKVTISAVGIGEADEVLLKSISTEGGGRYVKVADIALLSKAFVEETEVALKK